MNRRVIFTVDVSIPRVYSSPAGGVNNTSYKHVSVHWAHVLKYYQCVHSEGYLYSSPSTTAKIDKVLEPLALAFIGFLRLPSIPWILLESLRSA